MSKNKENNVENLRPKLLKDYIGQENVVKTLKMFIDAVNKRGKVSEHILFYGPPGIGKTTLSYIVANELKGEIKVTSGATITKTGDLAAILTNLKDNDVFFFFQAEDGIRYRTVTGVQTCALPILPLPSRCLRSRSPALSPFSLFFSPL